MTRPPASGYTLLEMVVVIAILALTTAMVAPAGYRMITSWSEASRVDEVARRLSALPALARDEGRELRMLPEAGEQEPPTVRIFRAGVGDRKEAPPSDAGLIELPEGWRIAFDERMVVQPNGLCSGGSGTLFTDRQKLPFEIDSPYCRARILPASSD